MMEIEKPDNSPNSSRPEKEEHEVFAAVLNDLMFIVCHRVRKPLAAMQGLFTLLESLEFKTEEKKKIFEYLNKTLREMEECTEEMVEALDKARKALERKA